MCEVVNIKHTGKDGYDVYIGRPSPFGNPYSHKAGTLAKYRVKSRKEAIEKFERYLLSSPDLLEKLHDLKGKRLGCWCHPMACHGDVIKKYVDKLEKNLPLALF